MTENKFKVAIIGAGYMAREHIRAFGDISNVSVVGIYSKTKERASVLANEFGITNVFDSISEMYDKTKADLVVVTVTELSMNQVSKECFSFPWFVLLEKPPGINVADAEDILKKANDNNRVVMVALNRRYYSSTQSVIKDIANYPDQRFIRIVDQEDQVAALAAGQPNAVVDNWMYANSIHLIDFIMMLGRGTVTEINNILPWDAEHPWVVLSEIKFDSGDIALYECIWNAPGPWSVSVSTREKRWEMRPIEQAGQQAAGTRKLVEFEVHPWDKDFKPGLRLQAALAIESLACNEARLPLLSEVLQTMKLIEGIYQ